MGWVYETSGLGTLGGLYSRAFGFNNSGQVVGISYITDNTATHAFISAPGAGALTDLGTLGGSWSYAYGLNNSGQVVGYAGMASGGAGHAFISARNGGALTDLGTLGGTNSASNGINDKGQAVGFAYISGIGPPHAFISSPNGGKLTDLGTFGGSYSYAYGINDIGQVVGSAYTASNVAHAFISAPNGGPLTDLGTLGGANSQAFGINNNGQVVGSSDPTGSSAQHAFLYTGSKMVDLSVLTGNGSLYDARGINDYAQIALSSATSAYLLTLHPSWSVNGSGTWDSAASWDFGGIGVLSGLKPGNPHDVTINPTTGANIAGPSTSTQVKSLILGGNGGAGAATLNLGSGTLTASDGVTIAANGILSGSGIVQAATTNGGQIQVNAGERLQLTGASTANTNMVRLLGSAANVAELDNTGSFSNEATGKFIIQNATYQGGGTVITGLGDTPTTITGGFTNAGQVDVTGSANNIIGPIDQVAGGQFILSGSTSATFYDTFKNNGTLKVSTGSTATFFGLVTGGGSYTGTGTSFYEGSFHVGNSPAIVAYDSNAVFDSSSILEMDLGGNTPGGCLPGDCAHHAHIDFNGDVQFNGGTLSVSLYGGFEPKAGDIFDLFGFYGTHSGGFANVLLPNLGNGLSWNTATLLTTGALSVNAVPVPGAVWLMGSALLGLAGLSRRPIRREA